MQECYMYRRLIVENPDDSQSPVKNFEYYFYDTSNVKLSKDRLDELDDQASVQVKVMHHQKVRESMKARAKADIGVLDEDFYRAPNFYIQSTQALPDSNKGSPLSSDL